MLKILDFFLVLAIRLKQVQVKRLAQGHSMHTDLRGPFLKNHKHFLSLSSRLLFFHTHFLSPDRPSSPCFFSFSVFQCVPHVSHERYIWHECRTRRVNANKSSCNIVLFILYTDIKADISLNCLWLQDVSGWVNIDCESDWITLLEIQTPTTRCSNIGRQVSEFWGLIKSETKPRFVCRNRRYSLDDAKANILRLQEPFCIKKGHQFMNEVLWKERMSILFMKNGPNLTRLREDTQPHQSSET